MTQIKYSFLSPPLQSAAKAIHENETKLASGVLSTPEQQENAPASLRNCWGNQIDVSTADINFNKQASSNHTIPLNDPTCGAVFKEQVTPFWDIFCFHS